MTQTLVLVGTGLIGGSIAAAAQSAGVAQVLAVDPHHGEEALALGLIDDLYPSLEALLDALDALSAADPEALRALGDLGLVFATPVPVTVTLLEALAQRPEQVQRLAWITEVGSTKHALNEGLQRLRALGAGGPLDAAGNPAVQALLSRLVPCHPMAGGETSGPASARPDLFQGARVLISTLAENQPEPIEALESFWLALGAQPIALPMAEHDHLLAAISHFPHLIAFALADMLANGPTAQAAQRLHGGGLRDTTRIAASSPELWADILLDNRQQLLDLMPQWQIAFAELQSALGQGERQQLVQVLSRAARWRRDFS